MKREPCSNDAEHQPHVTGWLSVAEKSGDVPMKTPAPEPWSGAARSHPPE